MSLKNTLKRFALTVVATTTMGTAVPPQANSDNIDAKSSIVSFEK